MCVCGFWGGEKGGGGIPSPSMHTHRPDPHLKAWDYPGGCHVEVDDEGALTGGAGTGVGEGGGVVEALDCQLSLPA